MFFESCGIYNRNFIGAHIPSDFTDNSLVKEYNLGLFLSYLLGN